MKRTIILLLLVVLPLLLCGARCNVSKEDEEAWHQRITVGFGMVKAGANLVRTAAIAAHAVGLIPGENWAVWEGIWSRYVSLRDLVQVTLDTWKLGSGKDYMGRIEAMMTNLNKIVEEINDFASTWNLKASAPTVREAILCAAH